VLLDFFATWCGACKSIEPALEALASRYKGRFKVAKLDIEKNPRSAAQYQIRATPTLIVFTNGQPAERVEGALPLPQLQELAGRYIRFTTRPR
jgi:thioredoxin 1